MWLSREKFYRMRDLVNKYEREIDKLKNDKIEIVRDYDEQISNLNDRIKELELAVNVLENKETPNSKEKKNMKKWLHGYYGETYDDRSDD